MSETNEAFVQVNNAGGTALLMSVNESLTAVKVSLARLEERVEKALSVHGDVTLLKSEVQQIRSDLKDFEERYDREHKEADERLKRGAAVAGLSASIVAVLITVLFWVVEHFKR